MQIWCSTSFEFPMTDAALTAAIAEKVDALPGNFYPVITVDHDYVPTEHGFAGPETKN